MGRNLIAIVTVVIVTAIALGLAAYSISVGGPKAHGGNKGSTQRTYKGNRPPVPNFDKPIDYVCWTNKYLAEGKSLENANIYDGFWRYHGHEEHMPDPNRSVEKQLRKLVRGPTWKSGQYPQVETYIERVAGYIRLFKLATNRPEYCLQTKAEPDMPKSGAVMPFLVTGEYALLVLLAEAWQEGNCRPSRFYDAWQTSLQHASHLGRSRVLLAVQRASKIKMIVYRSVRDAVDKKIISQSDFRKAIDFLSATDPGSFTLTEAIYCDWGLQLAFIQELYLGGRLNKALAEQIAGLDQAGGIHRLDIKRLQASRVGLPELVSGIDKYYLRLLDVSEWPISANLSEKIKYLQLEIDGSALRSHPLRRLIFARPDKPFLFELRALASSRATLLILLLHAYREKHGVWPECLSGLEFPQHHGCLIDPFSEQPFVYKSSQESFLLYSVNEDKVDNDGKHGPWSHWYPTESHTDFVFWPVQHDGD
jgi:hypothetical protein